MKSPMHDTSIFDGTGFESLHNDLQESGVAIASTTDELSRLEQERLEAIRLAEEPFLQPINGVQARLNQLTSDVDEQAIVNRIREIDFSELSVAALDIILRKHKMSLVELSQGIKELAPELGVPHLDRRGTIYPLLREFTGIRALERDLTASSKPVGLISVEWFPEMTDHDEDYGIRDKQTPPLVKRISAVIGRASAKDLIVEKSDTRPEELTPLLQPESIVLNISDAFIVKGYSDWGVEENELDKKSDHIIGLVSAGQHDLIRTRTFNGIAWAESLEGIFPQIDYTSPATSGVTKYLAWGSNVIDIVSRLASDDNAPMSTRETFRKIWENI